MMYELINKIQQTVNNLRKQRDKNTLIDSYLTIAPIHYMDIGDVTDADLYERILYDLSASFKTNWQISEISPELEAMTTSLLLLASVSDCHFDRAIEKASIQPQTKSDLVAELAASLNVPVVEIKMLDDHQTNDLIENKKPCFHIYTDGGCRGNGQTDGGLGAFAGVIIDCQTKQEQEYKDIFSDTTNNQMELMAVINGLHRLNERSEVHIYSDSAYVVNAYQQDWISGWKAKNWSRGKAGELKNRMLWIELDTLVNQHDVTFHKVKGHADNPYNNRADQLVNDAMDDYQLNDIRA